MTPRYLMAAPGPLHLAWGLVVALERDLSDSNAASGDYRLEIDRQADEIDRLRTLAAALEERCEVAERDADRLALSLEEHLTYGGVQCECTWALGTHAKASLARQP